MNVTKPILAALAFIFGIATTQAAALAAPSGRPVAGSVIELVAKKAEKAKKASKPKKAKKSASGKACSTYMYSKGRKCMDARAKS